MNPMTESSRVPPGRQSNFAQSPDGPQSLIRRHPPGQEELGRKIAWARVREQLDSQTGPRPSVVVILLRRLPSPKLNRLIQENVWIDNVSLKPREP